MIPTSWRKMSEMTWKGPDDGCARVLSSTQSDGKTVRGYSAEVTGPLRATQQEAIRDAERAIWAFGKAPEQCTADPVDSLAFAIYQHTSEDTLDDAGRARYRRAAEVALQIARGTTPDREALARALYTECETDRSQKWSARHPGASAAAPVWDRCIPEIREDWLSIADTAIRMVPTMTSDDLDRVKAQTDRLEALLVRVRASVDYEDGIEQTDDDLIEHLDGIMARLEMAERMVLDVSPATDRSALARHLYNTLMKHLTGATETAFEDMTEVRQDAWLAVADEALRAATVDASDNDAWPPGWKDFGNEYVWTSGHSYAENPRVPSTPQGRLAALILSGQRISTEDARELRDQLAVVGRKIAQVEHERDEARREIKIAHETLDTANVPRMAGTLSDRIRRQDERLVLQRREKLSARAERDQLQNKYDKEVALAHMEKRLASARLALFEDENAKAVAVRDDLIADYEARIGALEAINQRKVQAIALLSHELAEALSVKKVTS